MHDVIASPPGGRELRVPAVGFGTWPLRGEPCREAVAHALTVGYRHLDTARMYRNESDVGAGLRDSGVDRDEVLVVTKVRPGDADRDGVRREVEASLRQLQNEYRPGLDEEAVLAWCREHEAAYVAYSPLDVDRSARQVLTEIGERHDRSWAQVAIRWLIQQEQVATIPRSRDAGHREQNLAVFDLALDAEEMERIRALV